MRMIIVALALAWASNAGAVGSYLGVDTQDVNLKQQNGALAVTSTSTVITGSLPSGTNNIGDVDVLSLPALSAGTNQIGTVSGSTVTSIIKDSGGDEATVTGGRLDVNATITSADVSVSTVGIRGANGQQITSELIGSSQALHVKVLGIPDLTSKVSVYKSSDNMVVSGALTLTGLGKSIDLQAITNDCTFNLGGGESINVVKNTAESFDLNYTVSNPTVNLTAKSSGATWKCRIFGSN